MYDPHEIEPRWQKVWRARRVFEVETTALAQDKHYVLEMFPYPSGFIHMGHVRNYSIGDVIARHARMRGKRVLYPMGWDAFGLPAENAAIDAGVHPREWTERNIRHMRAQLQKLGYSYDWRRELATCHPEYYRWEQKLFVEMFERNLAYRKGSYVNYCTRCRTVLANEQVEGGTCWRCHTQVEQRELTQWFFRITAYAEELLRGLDALEGKWPSQVLAMQRHWIGRSEGAELDFALEQPAHGQSAISVFTTRPDTLFGATFMSIAPEHPLALPLARAGGNEAEVAAFIQKTLAAGRVARTAEKAEKEGVATGARCVNPATGEKIPIFVANFVLMEYGSGAVMAVPAHDQRDFEFARRYGLPVRVVVQPPGARLDPATMEAAYVDAGVMANSGNFDGTPSEEGKRAVTARFGKPVVSYRLRDWLLSRQRYWGAPIPMVHCAACGVVPARLSDLPIRLPDDAEIGGEGGSPLERHPTFAQTACPKCGGVARRETDTMDTFVESSWYFLRYVSPRETGDMFRRDDVDAWMPVDQYVGGIEHAVMHLLYARFFTRVLRDLGYLKFDEPFTRLLAQGMVCKETYACPEHGWLYAKEAASGKCPKCGQAVVVGAVEAMSKSKKNGVDPDDIVASFGADTARLFVLFAAPPEKDLEWNEAGVEGMHRFLSRVWRLVASAKALGEGGAPSPALRRKTHKTIRRVDEDMERFHFNTAIAALMELTNAVYASLQGPSGPAARSEIDEAVRAIVLLLSPFAPHLCEELWSHLGGEGLVCLAPWPKFDAELARDERVAFVVQVNGKLRGRVELAADASEADVRAAAEADPKIAPYVAGKQIVKSVFVPAKLLNLVAR
ncbi:MAG: leucine--tRNA ligase [Myxococcota bacterium]